MNYHYTLTTNEKNTQNRDFLQNIISSFWGKNNHVRNHLYTVRKSNNDFELDDIVRIELYCKDEITNLDRRFKIEKERNNFSNTINMIKNGTILNIASEVNIVSFSKFKNTGNRKPITNNTNSICIKQLNVNGVVEKTTISLNEFIKNKFNNCAENIIVRTDPSNDKKYFSQKNKDEKSWNINGTKFQASMTITNEEKFKYLINNGIYASKIYGFGLILFRIS